jgi:hypothetical protein
VGPVTGQRLNCYRHSFSQHTCSTHASASVSEGQKGGGQQISAKCDAYPEWARNGISALSRSGKHSGRPRGVPDLSR